MTMRQTLFGLSRSIVGMALIGLGLVLLFGNLSHASGQVSRIVGFSAEATQTFGELTAVGLAASQIWRSYLFDRRERTQRISKIKYRICRSNDSSFDASVEAGAGAAAVAGIQPQSIARRKSMRAIVLVKANKDSEAGVMPSQKLLAEMGKFNQELIQAGVMLAGDGLHPSSKGKRIKFSGQQRTVIDGPFTETKELVAGYWIWQVRSIDEAVEWLKRAPFDRETEVEIRPVFEAADFAR
jgi:hypothetical protein